MAVEVQKIQEGTKLTIRVSGKLNTPGSEELRSEIGDLNGIKELILDFKDVSYIASAGFRLIIEAYKMMADNKGSMKIINVNEDNMQTFRLTGLLDVLDVSSPEPDEKTAE